jgi:hypothetical protein
LADVTAETGVGAGAVVDVGVAGTTGVNPLRLGEVGSIVGGVGERDEDLVASLDVDLAAIILKDGIIAGSLAVESCGASLANTLESVSEKGIVSLIAGRLSSNTLDLVDMRSTLRGEVEVDSLGKLKQLC